MKLKKIMKMLGKQKSYNKKGYRGDYRYKPQSYNHHGSSWTKMLATIGLMLAERFGRRRPMRRGYD